MSGMEAGSEHPTARIAEVRCDGVWPCTSGRTCAAHLAAKRELRLLGRAETAQEALADMNGALHELGRALAGSGAVFSRLARRLAWRRVERDRRELERQALRDAAYADVVAARLVREHRETLRRLAEDD
jgi:hypothetical protein